MSTHIIPKEILEVIDTPEKQEAYRKYLERKRRDAKTYYEKNREKLCAKHGEYIKTRYHSDPDYRDRVSQASLARYYRRKAEKLNAEKTAEKIDQNP